MPERASERNLPNAGDLRPERPPSEASPRNGIHVVSDDAPPSEAARPRPDRDQIVRLLTDLLAEMKYGQVLITVHDSRIVQVEKTDRYRFN